MMRTHQREVRFFVLSVLTAVARVREGATMAKKMSAKAKTPATAVASGEWVCELAPFPAHIEDPAGSYQPDGLLWADTEGKVLGFRIGRPGTVLAEAGASFREATRKPMSGKPHVPASIRAGSEELADALRAAVGPGVEVYVGETPETAAALAAMAESFEGDSAPATHFARGIEPAAVAALYRAAARLYRSAPWKKVAPDHGTFTVSSPALGLSKAVVIVLGHLGEQYGILLFRASRASRASSRRSRRSRRAAKRPFRATVP